MNDKKEAAISTLANLGYTYEGGILWKPPLGKAPDFNLIDRLKDRIAHLENEKGNFRQALEDIASGEIRREHCTGPHCEEELGVATADELSSRAAGALDWDKRTAQLSARQAMPLTDQQCDNLIAALCPDFCDERFPGDRLIMRQLAREALSPTHVPPKRETLVPAQSEQVGLEKWICLLCKSSRAGHHGTLDDKTTPCPNGKGTTR